MPHATRQTGKYTHGGAHSLQHRGRTHRHTHTSHTHIVFLFRIAEETNPATRVEQRNRQLVGSGLEMGHAMGCTLHHIRARSEEECPNRIVTLEHKSKTETQKQRTARERASTRMCNRMFNSRKCFFPACILCWIGLSTMTIPPPSSSSSSSIHTRCCSLYCRDSSSCLAYACTPAAPSPRVRDRRTGLAQTNDATHCTTKSRREGVGGRKRGDTLERQCD